MEIDFKLTYELPEELCKDDAIYMTSRLYFPEKYYKTKEEALSDFNSDICFDVCCQDVFGDG